MDFPKNDRDSLLSLSNTDDYRRAPSLNLDKNKVGGEEKVQQLMAALRVLEVNGYEFGGAYGSVLGNLQELSEGIGRNPSVVIESIDTRMTPHISFLNVFGAWRYTEWSIHDKPASKIFGTCASMSLTLIDLVDAVIEDVKKGIKQSSLLLANMHSNASQEEINDFVVKASGVIDWLSTLRNLLKVLPIFCGSTLFKLAYAIKDRWNMIPKEEWAKKISFKERFFAIFPECEGMKDNIGPLLDEIDLLDQLVIVTNPNNIFQRSIVLQLDAEIIRRIVSSNDSQLIFVATGRVHAVHCAWLLENEGYEVLYATKPPVFLEECLQHINPRQDPVDGSTLTYAFDPRLVLQERYIRRLVATDSVHFSAVKDAIINGRRKAFDHLTPPEAAELYERLKDFLDEKDRDPKAMIKLLQRLQIVYPAVGTVLSLGALFAIYRFAQNPRFLSCKGIGTLVLAIAASMVNFVAFGGYFVLPSMIKRQADNIMFTEWIRNHLEKQAVVNE